MKRLSLLVAAAACLAGARARAADLPSLWAERAKCTVAVEYVTETELERRPTIAYGTVVDSAGTIILPSAAIDLRISPRQMKDFKVYLPGDPEGSPAEYLGRDAYTGWHFVRAGPSVLGRLVPVTAFTGSAPGRELQLADEVWGVGLRNKDEDFMPYILQSHVALVQALPQRTAIAQQEVAGPGLPVFDREGRFVGLGASSFGQTFLEFSGAERGGSPIMLVNLEAVSYTHLDVYKRQGHGPAQDLELIRGERVDHAQAEPVAVDVADVGVEVELRPDRGVHDALARDDGLRLLELERGDGLVDRRLARLPVEEAHGDDDRERQRDPHALAQDDVVVPQRPALDRDLVVVTVLLGRLRLGWIGHRGSWAARQMIRSGT